MPKRQRMKIRTSKGRSTYDVLLDTRFGRFNPSYRIKDIYGFRFLKRNK